MISTHGRRRLTLLAGACVLAFVMVGCGNQEPEPRTPVARPVADVCVVCTGKIGDDAVTETYKGGKFKLCSKDCGAKFKETPTKYVPVPQE